MNLSVFPLPDLLQARAHASATGKMQIFFGEEQAYIYLVSGRVVHAEKEDVAGEAAFHMIMNGTNTGSQWFQGEEAEVATLFKPMQDLLVDHVFLEGMGRDELVERFGNPPTAAEARAKRRRWGIVVHGETFDSFRMELNLSRVIVGRESELCNIVIPDASVSSQHGMFLVSGGSVQFKDLGSTNGTWVDGQLVSEVSLEEGQYINLGNATVELVDLAPQKRDITKAETAKLGSILKLPVQHLSPVNSELSEAERKKLFRNTAKIEPPKRELS